MCGTERHGGQSEHDRSGAGMCLSGLPHLLCHQCQRCCNCHADHAGTKPVHADHADTKPDHADYAGTKPDHADHAGTKFARNPLFWHGWSDGGESCSCASLCLLVSFTFMFMCACVLLRLLA